MDTADGGACCRATDACVFDKALLSRSASCSLARRHAQAEGERIACGSQVALIDCTTLVALLRERSTFALRLPRGPVRHAHALKLQCGGVHGLMNVLQASDDDVHGLVVHARERWGSLSDLPWPALVRDIVAWQPRRRSGGPR